MKINTRFNPTANAPLHIGHVYMGLLNEYMAHESGGRFVVRFDDNTRWWWAALGDTRSMRGAVLMHEQAEHQLDDLLWMGLEIDEVVYQSDTEKAAKLFLAQSRFQMVVDHAPGGVKETAPIIRISGPRFHEMPMGAWIVAEKVVLDYWEGTNAMIRGPELLQENGLYMYFCALLGFRFPRCYYVPLLSTAAGVNLGGSQRSISKTRGNWQVQQLREAGRTPEQIRGLLRESCLVDPAGPWRIDNVKNVPALIVSSEAFV